MALILKAQEKRTGAQKQQSGGQPHTAHSQWAQPRGGECHVNLGLAHVYTDRILHKMYVQIRPECAH